MSRKSNWKINLLLLVISFFLTVLLAELILRILGISYPNFFMPNSVTGFAHRPGARGWYQLEGKSYVRISDDGLRDRAYDRDKPPGTIRIAVLGDSFAEALQVPVEKTFWDILEKNLALCPGLKDSRIEVINFGTSGYGTALELLMMRHMVWEYSPDIVLLAFFTANDISDNSRELKKLQHIPYFVYKDDRLVLDNSFLDSRQYQFRGGFFGRLYNYLNNHSRIMQLINTIRSGDSRAAKDENEGDPNPYLYDEVYRPPRDESWREAWRVTEGLLRMMDREVRSHGAQFLLVLLTNPIQVHPDSAVRGQFQQKLEVLDLFYPDHRIKKLAEDAGIPVLLLAPDFQKYAEEENVFLHGFGGASRKGHWNETGHRMAGERISRWICAWLEEKKD